MHLLREWNSIEMTVSNVKPMDLNTVSVDAIIAVTGVEVTLPRVNYKGWTKKVERIICPNKLCNMEIPTTAYTVREYNECPECSQEVY